MKKIFLSLVVIIALSGAAVALVPSKAQERADTKPLKKEAASLSPEKEEMLKKAVAAYQEKIKEHAEKEKSASQELRGLLTAEKFDKETYLKKAAEYTKLKSEKFISKVEAIAEIAPKFTAEERKLIMRGFKKHYPKKHDKPKTPKAS